MGAAFFYHLTDSPLEVTLPMLLGKARQAGWRVAVRATSEDRCKWLDQRLWLGPEDGFLPHGCAGTGFDADQPILLTTRAELPNTPACLMTVDGAEISADEVNGMERCCVLFDGNDDAAVQNARTQWKALTDAGCSAEYWAQSGGRWEKKAER
ncbi:DNA polymerase III subunit chi [Aliiroseovarius sp. YM-037]|uniref:DNA polymerase III subunit chi n=1 Tax=Aliiroseovarius sp. YM-037 TaxID=3341728 RepID=UPI003A80F798